MDDIALEISALHKHFDKPWKIVYKIPFFFQFACQHNELKSYLVYSQLMTNAALPGSTFPYVCFTQLCNSTTK